VIATAAAEVLHCSTPTYSCTADWAAARCLLRAYSCTVAAAAAAAAVALVVAASSRQLAANLSLRRLCTAPCNQQQLELSAADCYTTPVLLLLLLLLSLQHLQLPGNHLLLLLKQQQVVCMLTQAESPAHYCSR
jgi:hypothetical protein